MHTLCTGLDELCIGFRKGLPHFLCLFTWRSAALQQHEMQSYKSFHFAVAVLVFVDKGASGSMAVEWWTKHVCGGQQLMGRRIHYGRHWVLTVSPCSHSFQCEGVI